MKDFPLKHVSIRVPWHDAGWAGTVCHKPHLNGACAKLKGITANKDDLAEQQIAGQSLDEIPCEKWPCCVEERATFMAPFEITVIKRHALAKKSPDQYGHFVETPQRFPAFSAGILPFRWMMKGNLADYQELYELDLDDSREPELGYDTNWVHEAQNQTALLNSFAAHIRREDSLCLFYAKHVPFVEGVGRILIGVGRVKAVGGLTEYSRSREGMRGMVWERPLQHSIRPNGQDGFLMPYAELLKIAEQDQSIDLAPYVAHAPAEQWEEFSYASELVCHDAAISALLSIENALGRIETDFGIATEWQRQWLHDELIRLWKVRGPFPGLGAVLKAFGLSRGIFVAHHLQQRVGDNADPWPEVDLAFSNPGKLPQELRRDLKELATTWKSLSSPRRAWLRLLSRFELTAEQAEILYDETARAKVGWGESDRNLINNPYRIYEISRQDPRGIELLTVDRGVFPEDVVRLKHPLEQPSQLESSLDFRRVRAFTIQALENAAAAGHTLQFAGSLAEEIRNGKTQPKCLVTADILAAVAPKMEPEVMAIVSGDQVALQLKRYETIRELVRKQVVGRVGGQRHVVALNWSKLIEEKFGSPGDPQERAAQQEKASALLELAESRFSVLIGPAGAGKTSVLGFLCSAKAIKDDGLLLLAPTGKARVRMQELASGAGIRAQTIAQFLLQQGRYDALTGRYHVSDKPKATGFGTVIVDESSMLTEDMLGALFDAVQGVKRFILVGDPAQLPPIGAGRPFVDIVSKLKPANIETRFPRIAPGYAELTIERRQIGSERPDLRLARWFGAVSPAAGEDDVLSAEDETYSALRFVSWSTPEDFKEKLISVLAEELNLTDPHDQRGFNKTLGAITYQNNDYFNSTRDGKPGAVAKIESWQILSPIRGMTFGVSDINRQIHECYRANLVEFASRERNRVIPKPAGDERIVYGDKVINLTNHRRDGKRVYPRDGAIGYLANGEIGIIVGQWKTPKMTMKPNIIKVEFASQPGFTYDFYANDFKEEGDAALELAYALTVHKAQGSQFGLVILVLPEGHPIISRELIYTALTRHQDRVVVMYQGQLSRLKEFASPHRSETARRRTNLLTECKMLEFPQAKGSIFLQDGLIHRTSKGLAVRSKSELLIAEALHSHSIPFEYEKPLSIGGKTRYPDFTIEDDISGRIIYWEHLGMLDREDYRSSWAKKLKWYNESGILPVATANIGAPVLVTTEDSAELGLDMAVVTKIIREVCGG
ncbi:MAG: AAA family ATPase [Veillonellaceae bacterium]|nr:AAA family ATPase [Veillonellaceae bacterium]